LAAEKNQIVARLEYAIAVSLLAALRRTPLAFAERLARAVALLLDRALPRLRRVAETNLSFAFPALPEHERERIINGVFGSIARLLVTFARLPDLNEANIGCWIEYEGLEHYRAAKEANRGVLIATAHLGNWELSAFAHALMTEPMNVMVRPLDNPMIDAIVEARRTLSGNRLIYKHDGARAVLRALRGNEAVGILVDQNTSAAEGVFVDFFGKKACASPVFVKFAYHSGAPVILGFALWEEARRKYVLRFYPRIELTGDAAIDTQRLHTALENVIRAYPDQWLWIHRRWKTRPESEPALYS
jgi:KDO2-lipid IV(A) lauroyltransferase